MSIGKLAVNLDTDPFIRTFTIEDDGSITALATGGGIGSGEGSTSAALSKDQKWLSVAQSSTVIIMPWNEGSLGTEVQSGSVGSTPYAQAFANNDSSLLAIGTRFAGVKLYRVNEDQTITLLDESTDTLDRIPEPFATVTWNSDDTRFCVSNNNGEVSLFGWDGATLTRLARSADLGTVTAQKYLPGDSETKIFVAGAGGDVLKILDTSGDTFAEFQTNSLTDGLSSKSGIDVSVDGAYGAVGQSPDGSDPSRLVDLSDASIPSMFPGTERWQRGAFIRSGLFVGIDDQVLNIANVYQVEGGLATLLNSTDFGDGDIVRQVMVTASTTGPTTEEQIFQATYANASAAPPKRTALVRPLDVQRSIDTDVSWLARNPKDWTVKTLVPIGELQFYRPGNIFWVRDNQPGLRQGRNVFFKGFAADDIRPTEFVSCIFTAPTTEAS